MTSEEVDLIVYYAPILTTDIESKSTVNEGQSITLTIAAEMLDSKGTSATFTWYKDKKALKDADNVLVPRQPT